jgi:hypothetical protein
MKLLQKLYECDCVCTNVGVYECKLITVNVV